MDKAIMDSAAFMLSSMAIVLIAGAMIVETMMRLKPVAESTSVTVHFLTLGQSLGLVGGRKSVLCGRIVN